MKIRYWNREETGGISLLRDSNCWKISAIQGRKVSNDAVPLGIKLRLWTEKPLRQLQGRAVKSHPQTYPAALTEHWRAPQPQARDKWTCGRAASLPSLLHIFRKSVKLSFFKKGSCLLYRFSPTWTNSGQSISAREATAWYHPRSEALLGTPHQPLMRASPTSNKHRSCSLVLELNQWSKVLILLT